MSTRKDVLIKLLLTLCSPGHVDSNYGLAKKCFPSGFIKELKSLAVLSWPAALGYLFTFSMTSVALIFCGHLGKSEMAAVSVALSVINITGIFICSGMTSACDTFFSQAYGGHNHKLMGIFFQRSLFIMSLTCIVCWAIHLNVESLLTLMNQDAHARRLAGEYIVFFMPGLMFNFWFQVCIKFLQSQDVVIPVVVVGFLGNAFNIISQYIAVNVMRKGIRGSAVAQASSWMVMFVVTVVYMKTSGILKDKWGGLTIKAVDNSWPFMKLAVGGLVLTLSEWCMFEGAIIAMGSVGIVQQGSMAISTQIEWIALMFVYGIGIGCSIRVGQHLGAGNSEAAKTVYRVAQITSLAVTIVVVFFLLLLKDVIPSVFSSDMDVKRRVAGLICIVSVQQILDTFATITTGALRGCGLQLINGTVVSSVYLVLGIPVCGALMFCSGLESAVGFWWGVVITYIPICCIMLVITLSLDWAKHAEKAVALTQGGQKLLGTGTRGISAGEAIELTDTTQLLEHNGCAEQSSKFNLYFKIVFVLAVVFGIFCAGLFIRIYT